MVEFKAEPNQVFLDCDDGCELLKDMSYEQQQKCADKPISVVLEYEKKLRTGYGLYVNEIKLEQIVKVDLRYVNDDGRQIYRRCIYTK